MAQRSKSSFKSTKDTRFADNSAGAITAQNSRDMYEDTADSFLNFTDNTSVTADNGDNQSSTTLWFPAYYNGCYQKATTILTAAVLTANSSPVTLVSAPGAGYAILPISFFVYLNYNSAAYATNTTFRFEINGNAVSATNTGLLPATASRYGIMHASVDVDAANINNSALVFEVQAGNPTAGNSPIYIKTIYRIVAVAEPV